MGSDFLIQMDNNILQGMMWDILLRFLQLSNKTHLGTETE